MTFTDRSFLCVTRKPSDWRWVLKDLFNLHSLALKCFCCCFRVFFYGLFLVIVLSWTSDFNGRGLACPRHVHPTSSRHPSVWVIYNEGDALKSAEARVLSRQKLNLSLNPPTTTTLFAGQSVKYFCFTLFIVSLFISRPDTLLMLPNFLKGHRYACNGIEVWLQC